MGVFPEPWMPATGLAAALDAHASSSAQAARATADGRELGRLAAHPGAGARAWRAERAPGADRMNLNWVMPAEGDA